MDGENHSSVDIFWLVGFSDFPQIQVSLFVVFVLMYLLTLGGNTLVMAIICFNPSLHTPMYFFITNLAFIDICYTTILFPQMLIHFFQDYAIISLTECLLQMYFFLATASTEFLLLAVMAFDRYAAICNPLRYMTIMNKTVCITLASGTLVVGFIDPLAHIILLSRLSYCESHTINHFFCDVTALMKLSCSSTRTIEALSCTLAATVGIMSFTLIITSYTKIISSVLKMKSKAGREKAFSTCGSHLTVVILFFAAGCATYMRPASTYSMRDNKLVSLTYTAITPLCNPIIYSLKNADFKNALKKAKHVT